MLEILFCLFAFSQCLYLSWLFRQLEKILADIQEVLRSANHANAD